MAVFIIPIYIIVVVFPITRSGIIWRININAVHLSTMSFFQKIESLKVVPFNDEIPRKSLVFAESSFRVFNQNRNILFEHIVNGLGMLFPDQSIFLFAQSVFDFIQSRNRRIVIMLRFQLLQLRNHSIPLNL